VRQRSDVRCANSTPSIAPSAIAPAVSTWLAWMCSLRSHARG
jgi:hypothetical protein